METEKKKRRLNVRWIPLIMAVAIYFLFLPTGNFVGCIMFCVPLIFRAFNIQI